MELRKGYKQTEIGIIPNDWSVSDVASQFNFFSNATNPRADLSYKDEGYRYIHYGDIHTILPTLLNLDGFRLPRISMDKVMNKPLLKKGDIIVADASEDLSGLCKSIEIVSNTNELECVAGLHTFLLRPKNDNFASGFCGYLFNSDLLQQQYLKLYTGLKVFGVSRSSMKSILLPNPSKKEQQAIAEALNDADALIASLEKLIEKKRHLLETLSDELLSGKRRLGGFQDEWKDYKLDELVAEINTGKLDANAMVENGKYHFFTCAAEPFYIDQPAFCGDAILVSGNGANIGYVHKFSGEFNAYQRTYVLQNFSADFEYIYYQMKRGFRSHIEPFVNGGNTPYITMSTVASMGLPCPSIEEQKAIAEVLHDFEKELTDIEVKLNKAKKVKAGMMQELLTGRTRLI